MTPEPRPEDKPVVEQPPETSVASDRRVEARRRFLRIGAGGSAALVVTVAHKRAFAGIKKNAIASNCVSLQGVPDLKGADKKKALETSAMGSPKGLVCRPRDKSPPSCGTRSSDSNFRAQFGTKVKHTVPDEFKDGCGSIEQTVEKSYNYRLYEKGYCPLKYDANVLDYDRAAKYYVRNVTTVNGKKVATFIGTSCQAPPL